MFWGFQGRYVRPARLLHTAARLRLGKLRASLGQPLRLHPASDLAGLAAGAGPAASPCSSPWPIGWMASRGIKGEGFARHPRPVPALRSGLRPPVPPLTPLPAKTPARTY